MAKDLLRLRRNYWGAVYEEGSPSHNPHAAHNPHAEKCVTRVAAPGAPNEQPREGRSGFGLAKRRIAARRAGVNLVCPRRGLLQKSNARIA